MLGKMRKVALTLGLTLCLTATSVINAFAVPTQADIDKVMAQIGQLDSEIIKNIDKLDKLKSEINKKETEVKSKQEQIANLEQDIEEEQELYNERLRNYYINNNVGSFLMVVLESNSFSDFMERVEIIKSIAQYDHELKTTLKESIHKTDKEKKELETILTSIKNDKAQAEIDKKNLEAKKNEATELVNKYKDEIKAEEERIEKERQEEIKRIEAEKLKQEEEARRRAEEERKAEEQKDKEEDRPSRGDDNTEVPKGSYALGDEIVAYSKLFLGRPYVWGANGPNSFDCSGFTRYVYRHFGISIPRVAADQQDTGRAVSYDNLRPGDLVFFKDPATHVGIYVGGGKYIHAPQTGDVVKISNLLTRKDFTGGRRYYND